MAVPRLGLKVTPVVVVGRERVRDAIDDVDAEPCQAVDFVRVVGEQADPGEPQVAQHFRRGLKNPLVVFEPKPPIGFHRVVALVLQRIGAQFVDQSDPAALLGEVEQHPGPGLVH